jgi:hypothetical protein
LFGIEDIAAKLYKILPEFLNLKTTAKKDGRGFKTPLYINSLDVGHYMALLTLQGGL